MRLILLGGKNFIYWLPGCLPLDPRRSEEYGMSRRSSITSALLETSRLDLTTSSIKDGTAFYSTSVLKNPALPSALIAHYGYRISLWADLRVLTLYWQGMRNREQCLQIGFSPEQRIFLRW